MNPPTHTPFNGDHFIGAEIRRLVAQFHIQTIVETGMWSAHSTREFATMVHHVVTIDPTDEHLLEEFGLDAVKELPANVWFLIGDSARAMENVLLAVNHPVLIYLDAHGGGTNGSNVNPIMEELEAIARVPACRNRCVLCIHDFLVPGKPWGYNGGDWGRGFEPLSYDLLRGKIEAVYPRGHCYHYNEEAAGCQRGIIYLTPKHDE